MTRGKKYNKNTGLKGKTTQWGNAYLKKSSNGFN